MCSKMVQRYSSQATIVVIDDDELNMKPLSPKDGNISGIRSVRFSDDEGQGNTVGRNQPREYTRGECIRVRIEFMIKVT